LSVHVSRGTDNLRVKWTETAPMNAGYCDIADGGFGSKLLDITIAEHLQGSYTRTYTEGGTEVDIILPSLLFSDTPSSPLPS
jgi:two-component sensor histidine kinase